MDEDPQRPRHAVFLNDVHNAGTATKTRIQAEQSDSDHQSSLKVIPTRQPAIELATQTATFVAREGGDRDPGKPRFAAIPRWS